MKIGVFFMNNNHYDKFEEFEGWEIEYELLNNKQYDKLIEFRERFVKVHPNSIHSIIDLCEAYCLNGEYQKSLNMLQSLYHDGNDEIEEVQYMILDSLKGLGKSFEEFNWILQPDILSLDTVTCDMCFDLVKNKRKGLSPTDLYIELYNKGYMEFEMPELVDLLMKDLRFNIVMDGHPMSAIIKKRSKRI